MTKTQIAAARASIASFWAGSASASVMASVADGKTNHSKAEKRSARKVLAGLRKGVV